VKWQKVATILDYIFLTFGFTFFIVFTHELVHVIDGWNDNIAMCIGFLNAERVAFVVNGDNYTLYQGELWAYAVTFLLCFFIAFIWKKETDERRGKMSIDKQYNDILDSLKIRRIDPVNKKPDVTVVPMAIPVKKVLKKKAKKKVVVK